MSVRSGAPMSMPGMMDTVLNLGLNDQSINGLIAQTENPRFAWDSYRRFIQMFSNVVMGLDGDLFENAINVHEERAAAPLPTPTCPPRTCKELVAEFKQIFSENVSADEYPSLRGGRRRRSSRRTPWCSCSWPSRPCSAAGTTRARSSTASRTRSPTTWAPPSTCSPWCSATRATPPATGVCVHAQPRQRRRRSSTATTWSTPRARTSWPASATPSPIADLEARGRPRRGRQASSRRSFVTLENHFRDMCDIEFTIEQGKLWMLQTRVGKRTAAAALHIAIEMEKEGLITKEEAVMRVDPEQLDQLLHPQFDKNAAYDVLARGLNASPGAAVGEAVFAAADAVAAAEAGRKCVLVRWETNPDDLAGMIAAEGILTAPRRQDAATRPSSPAAWARPACAAPRPSRSTPQKKEAVVRRHRRGHPRGRHDLHRRHHRHRGAGRRRARAARAHRRSGHHPGVGRRVPHAGRARQRRQPRGRAARPATSAPQGIGLCRTEHMFLGDRKQIIQTFILNEDDGHPREGRRPDLFEAQTGDFYGMFKAMDGLPVIVRLLDPPLHEFLESPRALEVEIARLEATGGDADVIAEKRAAHGADRRHGRGQPDAGPARLPPGHRVSRSCPSCRCAPSQPPPPS